MLQTFYGSYTKILTIFGSIQNLLFEFKYQTLLNKKEKEKKLATRPARLASAHAGSSARSERMARAAPSPHADTDGRVPPVSSVFFLAPHCSGDRPASLSPPLR
jgi:hypothetical protein